MGSEGCFPTNEDLDQQILRSPWADYPLPPLHKACRDGDVQSLLYLVIQGDRLGVFRSVNEQDQFLMWTPAHWAAYFGQLECLMRLVKCGLNLDVADGRLKQTAVHLAAFSGNALVLDWVLSTGATADKKDSLGETAVFKAIRCGSTECLHILHKHGASMNTVNSSRQSPSDIAQSLKRNQCLHFLKSLNGLIYRPPKRTRDGDSIEDPTKRARNNSHNMSINVSVSSMITNGTPHPGHQEKLLAMMEANGQYPINIDHSNIQPNHAMNGNMQHSLIMNGDMHHNNGMNGDMHRVVNGNMEHAMNGNMDQHAMNGNMEHAMNGNMDQHAMNGNMDQHAMNGNMDQHAMNGDIHMDHGDHSFFNQAPQRCMMLCGHFQ